MIAYEFCFFLFFFFALSVRERTHTPANRAINDDGRAQTFEAQQKPATTISKQAREKKHVTRAGDKRRAFVLCSICV